MLPPRTKILCAAEGSDPSRGSPKLPVNCPGSAKYSPAPAFHDTCLLFQMIGSSDDGLLKGEKLNDGMLLRFINYYNVRRRGFALCPQAVKCISCHLVDLAGT